MGILDLFFSKKRTETFESEKAIISEPETQTVYDFVAIDFETSDNNHSICSAAVVGVKNGEIVSEKHWYIKPSSDHFEKRNIAVHGIDYQKVMNEPSFIEIWQELKLYVENQKLVAHNTLGTEIVCLNKAFEKYQITPTPKLDNYECTLELSRILLPNLDNHKLTTVVEHLRLGEFNHHDALDDARICAKVYLSLMQLEGANKKIEAYKSQKKQNKEGYFKSNLPKANLDGIEFAKLSSINGKNIVVTGIFDNFPERTLLMLLLEQNGAKIQSSVNSKTDFVVMGERPGPSKIEKAKALKIRMISEEEAINFLPKIGPNFNKVST